MKSIKRITAALFMIIISARAVFADAAPIPDPRDYLPIVGYFVVGIVILAAVIALFFTLKKKSKEKENKKED